MEHLQSVLKLDGVECSQQFTGLKKVESITGGRKPLLGDGSRLNSTGICGDTRNIHQSCGLSPISAANKVASQHPWQVPRWTWKPKKGRVFYTQDDGTITHRHGKMFWGWPQQPQGQSPEYLHMLTHRFPGK